MKFTGEKDTEYNVNKVREYNSIPIDQTFKQSNVRYSVEEADKFFADPLKVVQTLITQEAPQPR